MLRRYNSTRETKIPALLKLTVQFTGNNKFSKSTFESDMCYFKNEAKEEETVAGVGSGVQF